MNGGLVKLQEVEGLQYQILSLSTLIAFYLIYVGKMLAQKKKGIQTDHIAKGEKKDTLMTVEIAMKRSHHGYTESALLYLSGVLAAGLFWIGRK